MCGEHVSGVQIVVGERVMYRCTIRFYKSEYPISILMRTHLLDLRLAHFELIQQQLLSLERKSEGKERKQQDDHAARVQELVVRRLW